MKVAVVGGGIAGLAAAWFLHRDGVEVTVYEADDRLGGKVQTGSLDGRPVELAADAFLARVPDAAELCRELGLGDELVSPATGQAYLWLGARLRPLPEGLALGVPTDLAAVARSGVLSVGGLGRAALEPLLPATSVAADRSVGSLVRARFGDEVFERLVDPLISGINAGRADDLSLDAVTPQLAAAARSSRSLLLGLRRARSGDSAGPVFLTVQSGLGRLVDRLVGVLPDVRTSSPVASLADLDADRVVLAVPAFAAADLLSAVAPDAAALLADIEYASVVLTLLSYPADAIGRSLDGSGFLVPRGEGRLMTACSWGSSKWPHWAKPGEVLFRVSAGRAGDDRALQLSDEVLVARLHAELSEAVGLQGEPLSSVVARWPRSFPQYAVGHLDRVARIEAALPPHIAVAGAALRGVGIPACIASGRAAAARVR